MKLVKIMPKIQNVLQQHKIFQIALGLSHSFFLLSDSQTLLAAGLNENGQLGFGDTKNRNLFEIVPLPLEKLGFIKQVSAGFHFSYILSQNNELWACGQNHVGQLGMGDFTDRNTFA